MVSIDEELEAAKAALDTLSAANPKFERLRKATDIAARAHLPSFSSEDPLNDARRRVGIALPDLIHAIENGPLSQEKIDKAKGAIETWMRHLKASWA